MTNSRRRLRRFGLLGLGAGLGLVLGAPLANDLAELVRAYGAMLSASAAYMLVGLVILARRSTHHRAAIVSSVGVELAQRT